MWSMSRALIVSDGAAPAKVLPDSLSLVADYQSLICYLAGWRIPRRVLTSCKVKLPGGSMSVP